MAAESRRWSFMVLLLDTLVIYLLCWMLFLFMSISKYDFYGMRIEFVAGLWLVVVRRATVVVKALDPRVKGTRVLFFTRES